MAYFISGSSATTASFGSIQVGGGYFNSASLASGGGGGGGGITISNNGNNRVLTGDGSNAAANTDLTWNGTKLTMETYEITPGSTTTFNSAGEDVKTVINGFGGSGTFTVDDAKSYFTSQDVGIKTTSPGYPLDVRGIIAATDSVGVVRIVGTTNGRTYDLKSNGARFEIRDSDNGQDRLIIGTNGNIGIGDGLLTPGAKLTVDGSISGSSTSTGSFGQVKTDAVLGNLGANDALGIQRGAYGSQGTAGAYFNLLATSGYAYAQFTGDSDYYLNDWNNLSSTGNFVGGYVNGTLKFVIDGKGSVSGSSTSTGSFGKVSVGHSGLINNSAEVGVAGNINVGNGQSTSIVYFENAGTDMYIEGNGSKLNIGSVGNTQVATFPAGGTLELTEASAGSITTRTDADNLVIESNVHAGLSILTPDNQYGNIIFGSPSTNRGANIEYNYSGNLFNIGTFHSNGQIAFFTGASNQRMTINSTGLVGIGTHIPDNNLHIFKGSAGSITSDGNSQLTIEHSSHASLQFLTPNDKQQQILFGDVDDADKGYINYNHSSDAMSFATNAGVRMSINGSGDVGIGTTTPERSLDIMSATGDMLVIRGASGNHSPQIRFSRNINSYHWYMGMHQGSGLSDFFIRIGDGSIRLAIQSGGNVGIGTGAPVAKLHSYTGDSGFNPTTGADELFIESSGHAGMTIGSGTTSQGNIYFGDSGDSGKGIIRYDHNVDTLGIGAGGSPSHLVINSSGHATFAGDILANDGSDAGSPAYSFTGDTDTGFFREGANMIGISTGGARRWTITTGYITSQTSGASRITNGAGSAAAPSFTFNDDGDTGMYRSGANELSFATNGTQRVIVTAAGDLKPYTDGGQNLGTADKRWQNVFSADLQLSNEGTEGNEVDGTTGSWTIQEGNDDLYLLNRKNGKKYRFKLEEII